MLMMTCSAPASEKLAEALDDPARRLGASGAVGRDRDVLEGRSLDLVGVAADRRAVLGQDRVLAGDALGRAEDVGRVGVLGDQTQRLLLASATDHDRDPGA